MDSFRKYLDDAKGYSEFVIALCLDVRGFSDWSLRVDSAQTALYMKKVYAELIDRYFSDAAYIKSTGDGLLVIIEFEEDELQDIVRKTVADSMKIVQRFGSLCSDDPIINFETPENVGVGIARGPASRLASGRRTLDYSGRVLNLATRLMELARPRGVVFDAQLGADLLTPSVLTAFERRDVFLKGVAPRKSMEVLTWPDEVTISRANQFPIGAPRWEHSEVTVELKDLLISGDPGHFIVSLNDHPPDLSTLTCVVTHDSVTAGKRPSKRYYTSMKWPVEYRDDAGSPTALLDEGSLIAELQKSGVGPTWPVKIKVSYRVS